MSLLDVTNVSVSYHTPTETVDAVENLSVSLEEGETLGLVGESGCGKSTVAKSILRILDDNGEITDGEITFDGRNLTEMSDEELRRDIRWKEISWITQNAMNALDPVQKVGAHLVEVLQNHTDLSKSDARDRAHTLLEDVGLDPVVMNDYPHELSGGQRQRVVVALGLLLNPSLIIADEPTTGLDVVVQDDVLDLIDDIQSETGKSMIFISHDISAVAEVADRVAVMYAGQIVELGPVEDVYHESTHPYTIGLQNAFPDIRNVSKRLVTIPGSPPNLAKDITGCRFANRCPFATDECEQNPEQQRVSADHTARCHYTDRAPEFREQAADPETWGGEE